MDFRKILEEYPYKTELHAHTSPVSNCSKIEAAFATKMYAELGCHTLTVTNHLADYTLEQHPDTAELAEYFVSDYYKAKEAGDKLGIAVAFGAEMRFQNDTNDYLVFGICPDDVEKMISYIPRSINEFYRDFKNDKNVIIHAHPFRNGMTRTPLGSVDGIETFNNHPAHNSRPGIATRFAKEAGLLVTGGSDFHDPDKQGLCLARTKHKLENSYDIAEAIKSRDIIFDMSGHIVIPYLF